MENIEKTKNWNEFFETTNEFRNVVKDMQDYISENIKNVKDESQLKLIQKIVKTYTEI